MLIGIPKVISPELLYTLDCMGHGDEIVLADAFYPGHSMSRQCLRADGVEVFDILACRYRGPHEPGQLCERPCGHDEMRYG